MTEEVKKRGRPRKLSSEGEKEMERLEEQFDNFQEQMTEAGKLENLAKSPKLEQEEQTKLSTKEKQDFPKHYLKPVKSIASKEKFNESYRSDYEFAREYVNFIAENHEVIGETIECWTKCFPGVPAEMWRVPVNKPVWAPRMVAEQIKECKYHVMKMDEDVRPSPDQQLKYSQPMIATHQKSRLDAIPISNRRSVFMGAS